MVAGEPPCPWRLSDGARERDAGDHADAPGRNASADELVAEYRKAHPDPTAAHAKLTEDQIRTIREVYGRVNGQHGIQKWLAKQYGVTPSTIRNIVLKQTWDWVK